MHLKQFAFTTLGLIILLREPPKRDERGISQSAESAILLAGAVAVAIIVVTLITAFVKRKLAEI